MPSPRERGLADCRTAPDVLKQPRGVAVFMWLLLAVFAPSDSSPAQPFERRFRPVTVVQGDSLLNPFSGGVNNPIFQVIDIDADGDPDLFVLDQDRQLTLYRNEALSGDPVFRLETIGFQGVNVGSWFRFVDIDADGDYDLFGGDGSIGVAFFRNTGTSANPQFLREIPQLRTGSGTVIVADPQSVHTFADIDGDSNIDFFSGNQSGTITFYRNTGTPAQFQFEFVTDMFQNIVIVGVDRPIGDGSLMLNKQALHGAMAFEFADIDADGDLDLFWGDFFNQSLYFLRNSGTASDPQLILEDSTFSDEAPVFSNGFNMPGLVDIDNDGDLDLLIGVLYFGTSIDSFHLYRNNGSDTSHAFMLETRNVLPTIDVGATSIPLITDLDGDGQRDLLIGGENGSLTLFRRTAEVFSADSMPRIDLAGLFNISPAAADLNNDGRTDLLIGDFNGNVRLYLQSDSGFVRTAYALDGTSFGLNAAPVLVDVDRDGLTDLFVGTGGGRIVHYRNQGTSTQPDFVLQTANFQLIDVGDDARPVFNDVDGDGDLDLVVGAFDGSLKLFRQEGPSGGSSFQLVPGFFDTIIGALRSSAAFEDYDADGDPDLIVGNAKGGLYFYENHRGAGPPPMSASLIQSFPNPIKEFSVITFSVPKLAMTTLKVYDLRGRELTTLVEAVMEPGTHSATWNALNVASGVYVCRLRVGELTDSQKMIVVR